jgi:hypothetical protein
MLRCLIAAMLIVLTATWAGTAAAGAPGRTVLFDGTITFTSPFCGDALLVEHTVGRITDLSWSNADGTGFRFMEHWAATTSTLTNTDTGVTLTFDTANLESDHLTLDPTTGGFTLTEVFDGLNFKESGTSGPPRILTGRATETLVGTYEVVGGVIYLSPVTDIQTQTAHVDHITKLLCS